MQVNTFQNTGSRVNLRFGGLAFSVVQLLLVLLSLPSLSDGGDDLLPLWKVYDSLPARTLVACSGVANLLSVIIFVMRWKQPTGGYLVLYYLLVLAGVLSGLTHYLLAPGWAGEAADKMSSLALANGGAVGTFALLLAYLVPSVIRLLPPRTMLPASE